MEAFFTSVENDLVSRSPLVQFSLALFKLTLYTVVTRKNRKSFVTVEVISEKNVVETNLLYRKSSISEEDIP